MGIFRFLIIILLFSASQTATATLYKCKSDGGILYSQLPCAPGSESQQLKYRQTTSPTKSVVANKTKPETFNKSNQETFSDSNDALNTENSVPYILRVLTEEEKRHFGQVMFSRRPIADHAERLQSAIKSFKLVLDDIYNKMGRPTFTKAFSKKFDRQIFSRTDLEAPRFEPDASISWKTYDNRVTALISCCVVNKVSRKVMATWRPNQSLEVSENLRD